jgi:hypothetical protein
MHRLRRMPSQIEKDAFSFLSGQKDTDREEPFMREKRRLLFFCITFETRAE